MGGTWQQQNKALPGAYINILGKTPLSIKMGSRGIVALPLELGWGEKHKIYKVHPGDDTLRTLGSQIKDIIPLQEALKNASEVLVCKVNEGTKANVELTSGVTATAVCKGSRGNKISVVTKAVPSGGGKHTITTLMDGIEVDKQTVANYGEFKANGFITIGGSGTLTPGTKNLANGADTPAAGEPEYKGALDLFKKNNFNVICYTGTNSTIKNNIVNFVRELREDEGVKIQAVLSDLEVDYEGVIVVENGVILSCGHVLEAKDACAWVAGATAGANVNQSNTGKVYEDAIDVNPRLLKSEMEKKANAGKFIFKVDNNQRVSVVYDINSLTTFTPPKTKTFRKNRAVRTFDGIANDLNSIWENNYMGKIDNTEDGRSLYRASLVEYFKALQNLNAIQNFSPEDVVIEPGVDTDAIVVRVNIQPVDSAEKLYMEISVI